MKKLTQQLHPKQISFVAKYLGNNETYNLHICSFDLPIVFFFHLWLVRATIRQPSVAGNKTICTQAGYSGKMQLKCKEYSVNESRLICMGVCQLDRQKLFVVHNERA